MKDYPSETYTGQFGPYDYLVVPTSEYNLELVAKVHELPFLLSEWSEFYRSRFARINKVKGEFVNLPIITRKECWDMGL